jgi:hypothetical protein
MVGAFVGGVVVGGAPPCVGIPLLVGALDGLDCPHPASANARHPSKKTILRI